MKLLYEKVTHFYELAHSDSTPKRTPMLKYEQFLQKLSQKLNSIQFAKKPYKETVFKGLHPSFSGFGEDIPLLHILQRNRGLHPGFFVDLGAFDPIAHSNTYLLHVMGWKGINVDANRQKIQAFNICRPNDINIHAGVSDTDEIRAFYHVGVGLASSFEEEWVQKTSQKHNAKIHSSQPVQCYNVNTLLEKHLPPNTTIDVLDVDIEGYDEKVLSVFHWEKYNPLVVLMEFHGDGIDDLMASKSYQLLTKHGYRLVYYFNPTTIFLRA